MVKKLSFAVEDAKLIDDVDNSQFAIMEIDAFASGANKHDMYVDPETLKRVAKSILLKPITWVYDKLFDDIGSHSSAQIAAGMIPANSPINFRELDDGRLMMTVRGLIWKKYSFNFLEFFQRKKDNTKGVSVEIEVKETGDREDGLLELKDFVFCAITALGDIVQPAIPNAKATVMQFSKEYEEAYQLEFGNKYEDDDLDFTIPEAVRNNAKEGLELYKKHSKGGTSVSLAIARHLTKETKAKPEKIRLIAKFLNRKTLGSNLADKTSTEWIGYQLAGGSHAKEWASTLSAKMKEIDERRISYFGEMVTMPYKNKSDINPALRGIDPPISLGQANEIAKQADAIGTDGKANGWAIAISSFKKRHVVKDGKWVKREEDKMSDKSDENEKENFSDMEEKEKEVVEKEEMATETPEEEAKEEEQEKQEEEKEGEKAEMSLDAYLDVAATLAFLENETDDYRELVGDQESEMACKMAADALKEKGKDAEFATVAKGMFAKLTRMAKVFAAVEEKLKTYMAENDQLKQFKSNIEEQQKSFEVERTLKEIENAVEMPKSEFEALREESKSFSLENIGVWENVARAKAFGFALKKKDSDNGITKMQLPYNIKDTKNQSKSVWEKLG